MVFRGARGRAMRVSGSISPTADLHLESIRLDMSVCLPVVDRTDMAEPQTGGIILPDNYA
jgi:hypothetical protein